LRAIRYRRRSGILNYIILKLKAAKIDLNCLGNDRGGLSQQEYLDAFDHLDKALGVLQGAIKPRRQSLAMNGTDNPSCPQCHGYNAMLLEPNARPDEVPEGEVKTRCRDCGCVVIGKLLAKGAAQC